MRTPRLARWLVSKVVTPDARQDVLQFLDEADGSRLWYWRQALSFSVRFAPERVLNLRRAVSTTDIKLALRMLVRYPGLTLVGTLGMAVGVAIAATVLSMMHVMMSPPLPFEEGDRIVAIRNYDTRQHQALSQLAYDFPFWKASAKSVIDIGAYRRQPRNLIQPGRTPETLSVAEMSAAGFRVTRVPPLMGRALRDEDELPSAPPVAVINEALWRSTLGGDPDILGRPLQLGDKTYTVVGVMPASYQYPVRDEVWIPWTVHHVPHKAGEGPAIGVFARIAPGFSMDTVRAEFSALGAQSARALPSTHGHVEAQVIPYTQAYMDMGSPGNAGVANAVRMFLVLLLAVISINVAVLVYARTAKRQNEIALRTALGAARGRIVTQLFVEALALALCAATVGLVAAWFGLRIIDEGLQGQSGEQFAFWMRFQLSPQVVISTAALTLMAAVIVGVVPALKATGRRVQSTLKSVSAGGGGMRLGRLWTCLIVAQVAFAVALMPIAFYNAHEATVYATAKADENGAEFLMANLVLDPASTFNDSAAFAQRFAARHAELTRALEREPRVAGVTSSLTNPGGEGYMFVEVEGVPPPGQPPSSVVLEGITMGHLAKATRVDPGYFDVYRIDQLAGRRLTMADASPGAATVVVSRTFADRFLDGNPLGKRLRYVGRGNFEMQGQAELNRWYEIVGVVGDFPSTQAATMNGLQGITYVYHAAAQPTPSSTVLSIRVRGGAPETFAGRLREVTIAVDPNIQLENVSTFGQGLANDQKMWRLLAAFLIGLALSVAALSGAGIYAMMSFSVSQRRREIGIRAALGADPRRILTGIFTRAFVQVSLGALAGITVAFLIDRAGQGEFLGQQRAIVLPAVTLFMMVVGVAAAYGPARYGLRIHPTEALRSE